MVCHKNITRHASLGVTATSCGRISAGMHRISCDCLLERVIRVYKKDYTSTQQSLTLGNKVIKQRATTQSTVLKRQDTSA